MNNKEIIERLIEIEQKAIQEYLDTADIPVKDYVNPETLGLLGYQYYVELHYQLHGTCFECEQNPCDEGCPYQFNKESEEQTNESFN